MEILEYIRTAFGAPVTIAVVLLVAGYKLLLGAIHLLEATRDYRHKIAIIESNKAKCEMLKLIFEIQVMKSQNGLKDLPFETKLLETIDSTMSAEERPIGLTNVYQRAQGRITRIFNLLWNRFQYLGIAAMISTHVFLRALGAGFLTELIGSSMDSKHTMIDWRNAFLAAGLALVGFVVSNTILKIGRSVGFSDPLRYVSYAVGIAAGIILCYKQSDL